MLISDAHRFIFVHIPKTAGTSISAALADVADRGHPRLGEGKHESLSQFMSRNAGFGFESYFTFSVVRHPLDRFVSHFNYLKTHGDTFPEMDHVDSLDDYARAVAREDMRVLRRPERYLPQAHWLKLDGRLGTDALVRFENLAEQLGAVLERLGLPPVTLPELNRSKAFAAPPSQFVIDFAREFYAEDFELLGYSDGLA